MHIEKYSSGGRYYLRLVQGKRISENSKGANGNKRQLVLSLGRYDQYDDGEPDYLERLRASFRDGHPLIPALEPYVGDAPKTRQTITFTIGEDECFGDPKRIAPIILDPVFAGLGLDQLFASIKHTSKMKYDLQGLVRLLTYGRLLEPASKSATFQQNEEYYLPLVKSSNEDNVYDTLDVIWENRKQIIQRMNTNISRHIGRKTSLVFYDVTNFFFEIGEPDDDVVDDEGNIVEKGIRKNGVSKENRKQPIVQIGLFLDDNGIPISLEMFPGNTLDHLTLRNAMRNTVDTLNLERFVLVADRGMYSGTNMAHVLNEGDGYIVSKSLKKSLKKEREWALDSEGYTVVSEKFKYKSRIVERTVTDEDGTKKKIQEKVVVYWSKAFYDRERHENESFIAFVEKLRTNPNNFRITSAQRASMRKYLKKDLVHKETGEIIDSKKLLTMIDEEKLKEFNDLMGYYQIVSSELEMDDLEIIDKYHELTRIEDQFHEMKGTLETRPIYVRTKEHIYAHLMICFIALTMMRVMQYKILKSMPDEKKSPDVNWSYGIPGRRLAKALLNWRVDMLPGDFYRMMGMKNEDLKAILSAFSLPIEPKLFSRGDLKHLKTAVKVFPDVGAKLL